MIVIVLVNKFYTCSMKKEEAGLEIDISCFKKPQAFDLSYRVKMEAGKACGHVTAF